MGNSIEKPVKVVLTPFFMKDNVKDKDMMEVPPKAQEYQMEIGADQENEMEVAVQNGGTYTKNGNIISFTERGLIKSGKLITNEELVNRRKQKEVATNKASGYGRD